MLDFLPPTAPDSAPTAVVPVEGGLEVAFAAVQQGEVTALRGLCAGRGGGWARRAPPATRRCARATATASGRARPPPCLTGLRNGVSYQVVYATFDAAGNRSANSPPASGTPQESYDFAEWYRSRNGPAEGLRAAPAGGSQGLRPGPARPGSPSVAPGGLDNAPGGAPFSWPLPRPSAQFQEPIAAWTQIRAGAYLPDLDSTFPAEARKRAVVPLRGGLPER
ncbi:MAG: hypothetical protein R3F43_28370 [bacterium]